jgi:hypothetical protein
LSLSWTSLTPSKLRLGLINEAGRQPLVGLQGLFHFG